MHFVGERSGDRSGTSRNDMTHSSMGRSSREMLTSTPISLQARAPWRHWEEERRVPSLLT